jgi:uncharacterized protein YaaN involved in tellurite resistance
VTEPLDENRDPQTTLAPTAPVPPARGRLYRGRRRCAEIEKAVGEIDLDDSNSILFFGTSAQSEVTSVADEMLEGVRNKDTGPAGQALNEMVSTLRGFALDDLDPNKKRGFFARLVGKAKPIAKVLQQYEQVRGQIDSISNRLDGHTSALMKDIGMLDRLYDKTLAYFHSLATYIAAGEEWLRRLDANQLPALQKEADASADVLKAQAVRDLRRNATTSSGACTT